MKKSLVLTVAISAFSFAGMAYAGGYKSAGCGLGSLVIQDDGIVQIFAATTNGTFGSQTFGITSGTSNCGGSGGWAKNDAAQKMYVSSTYDSITQEMAQGSGEHLNALASILGCDKDSAPEFSALMKKDYKNIVGQSQEPAQMLEAVKKDVSSNPQLKKSCNS